MADLVLLAILLVWGYEVAAPHLALRRWERP